MKLTSWSRKFVAANQCISDHKLKLLRIKVSLRYFVVDSDLAALLRGNKRKTSHMEFGVHQAILVVNDAARDCIPEELNHGLILTIYEAKGLEFDDIILYNFFKDSQVRLNLLPFRLCDISRWFIWYKYIFKKSRFWFGFFLSFSSILVRDHIWH